MKRTHHEGGVARPVWEIILPYLGVILFLTGLALLLAAHYLHDSQPLLSEIARDVALAFLPLAIISLIFELVIRRHYMASLRALVSDEIQSAVAGISTTTVQRIVDQAFEKRMSVDVETINAIRAMKKMGLERVMTRAELEVSDISFVSVTRDVLSESVDDREFFIAGRSLDFVSKQLATIDHGLRHGVHFRFLLAGGHSPPPGSPTEPEARPASSKSVEKLKELLQAADTSQWTGSLELRRFEHEIGPSFSSYLHRGKRVSVLNFDLGDDAHLKWAQVFTNRPGEKNFSEQLYLTHKARFSAAQKVLQHPSPYQFVYVYGLRDGEVLFVRKQGSETWELPGGKIEPGETIEEAAMREFREETGLGLHIVASIETKEREKIAFIGMTKKGVPRTHDSAEIAEVRSFPLHAIPRTNALKFPDTGYQSILAEISRRLPRLERER